MARRRFMRASVRRISKGQRQQATICRTVFGVAVNWKSVRGQPDDLTPVGHRHEEPNADGGFVHKDGTPYP